ncbi:MAG: hydrolase, HAD-superfamily, subfamily [Actinomycetia bacterium]|nr:hydrolase, HAD-superfamily, subfamily [Actinomycetes bacterium]
MTESPGFTVVVPTIGRPSLRVLLENLFAQLSASELSAPVIVVDDRTESEGPLVLPHGRAATILRTGGRGPAAARNFGWRAATTEWVVFLDDDVVPTGSWTADLIADLAAVPYDAGGSQGRIRVPRPMGPATRPTDWHRNTAGLERAQWATADMAYRRPALAAVDGFDESFPRAYREDADLGLRVSVAGSRIVPGRRVVEHPVRGADRWVSIRSQRGNADDARMRAKHGGDWRRRAGVPRGRLPLHVITVLGAFTAIAGAAAGPRHRRPAVIGGAVAIGLTADLMWRRIAPGPRTRDEIATMVLTTPLLAPAAVWHRVKGEVEVRRARRRPEVPARPAPAALLLDRDGTIVRDVPYNGDPELVELLDGVGASLERVRENGLALAVVTNQSGVARGMLSIEQVDAVNRRIDELAGPIQHWVVCPHAPDDGCACRKPASGMVLDAARRLGTTPEQCVVIGDTGADVEAATNAGARAILVPNPVTRAEEIRSAPEIAPTFRDAVDRVLAPLVSSHR